MLLLDKGIAKTLLQRINCIAIGILTGVYPNLLLSGRRQFGATLQGSSHGEGLLCCESAMNRRLASSGPVNSGDVWDFLGGNLC